MAVKNTRTAKRSADQSSDNSNRFEKVFVVLADSWGEEMHEANKAAVLTEALNNGAHPTAEPTFDGTEKHPDGVSLYLKYSVEAKAAEQTPTSAETLSASEFLKGQKK